MTPSEIKELRDRVRGLKGADREVDRDIDILFGPENERRRRHPSYSDEYVRTLIYDDGEVVVGSKLAEEYTGSTDAAVAFSEKVLPGAVRRVYDDPENDCSGCDLITLDGRSVRGSGAKWEHAIIDATLTALIETME